MAGETSNKRRKLLSPRMRSRLDRIGHWLTIGERSPLLLFALLLLLTIAIDLCDSFGIDDAADRTIIELVDGLRGPVYGAADGHRQGQQSVAVVLINDDTLRANGLDGLPLPYDLQASVLADVAAAEPRAILYDVYFPRSRAMASVLARFGSRFGIQQQGDPKMEALAREMRRIGARIPLLIGLVDECDPFLAPLRNAVTQTPGDGRTHGIQEVSLTIDRWAPRRYDPFENPPRCADQEPPRPAQPQPGKFAPSPKPLDTAAFGLYQAYCATARPGELSRLCPRGTLDGDPRPMALQWGFGVSEWQAERLPAALAARCGGSSAVARLFGYFGRGLTRAWWQEGQDDRAFAARCGYHDAVMANDITPDARYAAELRAQLKGKIVLIGFDIPTSADRRPVPYYGEVPGVFVHAMALDNLIEWNGDPARMPGPAFGGIDQLDLIQYLGLAASVLIFWIMRNNADRLFGSRVNQARKRRITAAIALAILLTTSLLGGILAYILSWSLASVILSGILPGGILGLGLLLVARGKSGGHRDVAKGRRKLDSA
jgi:hypothetical protein